MECHKCQHNGKGHDACLTCEPHDYAWHGWKSHVNIDSIPEIMLIAKEQHQDALDTALQSMSWALRWIMELGEDDRNLIAWRITGRSMAWIARRLGVNASTLHRRCKRLAEEYPAVEFVLSVYRGRLASRKSAKVLPDGGAVWG